MQETQVLILVQDDPTCCQATKFLCHNYWAHFPKSRNYNYWSPCTLAPVLSNKWSHHSEKPRTTFKSSPSSPQLGKYQHSNEDPEQPKININKEWKLIFFFLLSLFPFKKIVFKLSGHIPHIFYSATLFSPLLNFISVGRYIYCHWEVF